MAGEEPSLEARRRLGDLLKQAREGKRLSLRAAAKAAKVDRGTWSAVEEATRLPQRHKAAAMETVVDWGPRSFDEVLAGREPNPLPAAEPPSGQRREQAYGVIINATFNELVAMANAYAEAFDEQAGEEFLRRAAEIRAEAADERAAGQG